MPSTTSAVGGLTLPLTVGGANERVADPALDVLSDFLAWSLGNDLNDKLASLSGAPKPAIGTYNNAPSVFLFNPEEQAGRIVAFERVVPALFVWRSGVGEVES